jgi:hypothetical protein
MLQTLPNDGCAKQPTFSGDTAGVYCVASCEHAQLSFAWPLALPASVVAARAVEAASVVASGEFVGDGAVHPNMSSGEAHLRKDTALPLKCLYNELCPKISNSDARSQTPAMLQMLPRSLL